MKPATIIIHLRPLKHALPVEPRLKKLLKLALRAFGFKCTKCEVQ